MREIGYKTSAGSFVRNIFVRKQDIKSEIDKIIKKNANTDVYIGIFDCLDADGADTMPLTQNGARSGYYRAPLYFDIDVDGAASDDNAYAQAKQQTLDLLETLNKCFCVPNEAISVQFSGSKGFHIFAGGMMQNRDLPQFYKWIAQKLAATKFPHLDLKIYESRRLMRRPNTINSKTGLYCIPVTIDELKSCIAEQMFSLAAAPRKLIQKNHTYITPEQAQQMQKLAQKWLEAKKTESKTRKVADKPQQPKNTVSPEAELADLWRAKKFQELKAILKAEPVKVKDLNEALAAAKSYPMAILFGYPYSKNVCCCLHEDTSPSASLNAPNSKYKHWTLYCFSSNCPHGGRALDNVQVVQRLTGLPFRQAATSLYDVLNIRF